MDFLTGWRGGYGYFMAGDDRRSGFKLLLPCLLNGTGRLCLFTVVYDGIAAEHAVGAMARDAHGHVLANTSASHGLSR